MIEQLVNLRKKYLRTSSGVRPELSPEIYSICKRMGIPADEMEKHKNRYMDWGIPATWDHAAGRVIEERKMKLRKSGGSQ